MRDTGGDRQEEPKELLRLISLRGKMLPVPVSEETPAVVVTSFVLDRCLSTGGVFDGCSQKIEVKEEGCVVAVSPKRGIAAEVDMRC